MIENSGGSSWMSESVTHSRPLTRSTSADHFAGGTAPIVSRMAQMHCSPAAVRPLRAALSSCGSFTASSVGISGCTPKVLRGFQQAPEGRAVVATDRRRAASGSNTYRRLTRVKTVPHPESIKVSPWTHGTQLYASGEEPPTPARTRIIGCKPQGR